jgi:hypothetical protein
MKTESTHKITGQVIYLGPQVPQFGLAYGMIFRDGIHPHLYEAMKECAAIREMFIPVALVASVRRELNFDVARNLRGTTGRYVTFYRAIESWRTNQHKQNKPTASAVTIEHTHA